MSEEKKAETAFDRLSAYLDETETDIDKMTSEELFEGVDKKVFKKFKDRLLVKLKKRMFNESN